MKQQIIIASDHAGYKLKEFLKANLTNFNLIDLGTNSEESVDYPDYGKMLAEKVAENHSNLGILICGSGIGISIAANRNPKIRAALCHNVESAKLSRQHNNANVISLGARFLNEDEALEMVTTFLDTGFEGGRHQNRVEKLAC